MPSEPSILDHPRYASVHRALLTGLLGNIARRDQGPEYEGVRGKKLHLWPGSTLFKHRPEWIASAEQVQTTRLYARTVARIRPEWVEQAADHLVKRTYDEIRYDKSAGETVADEKVTLWGMTLIARRVVPYGPVDPKLSRRIFIEQGLAEGGYVSGAPFMQHNRRLIAQIEQTQSKARRRDPAADSKARFDFFDARIPEGIYNVRAFEQWRRHVEKRHPRLLFMARADLLRDAAADVTPDRFPDFLDVGGMRFALTYHFEPGHIMDGVTVTLPLTALGQVSPEAFEWLVPGMLRDKLIALIKTLPKQLRTAFVPVPDFADRILPRLVHGEGPLCEAAARELSRASPLHVPGDALKPAEVPDHLRMNYRVLDERGTQLAMGRDLADVRTRLAAQIRQAFAHLPRSQWVRDDLRTWDFGDLPPHVRIQHRGLLLCGYPALVDTGQSAALRLFDSPEAAARSMPAGLKRLLWVQLRHEMKFLSRNLPGIEEMALHFAPLGGGEELRSQLTSAIADRVFLEDWSAVRTQAEYERRLSTAWQRIAPAGRELCDIAARILQTFHEVSLSLSRDVPPLWLDSVRDMRGQLAHLVPRDFLTVTPQPWLEHIPRFLRGIDVRLRKLASAGLVRDRQKMNEIAPVWEDCLQRLSLARAAGAVDPALVKARWMIEELRISLFAQDLKTSIPISLQRVQQQLHKGR